MMQVLPEQGGILNLAIAGSSAGLAQSMLVSPMELVKTQMQMHKTTGIFETFQTIQKQAGIRGLYRGLGATILRDSPALGMYFACFEAILRQFGDSIAVILGAGGIAGVFSWMVSFPQDVIKTRLQADSFGKSQKYRGAWHCLQVGWKQEGPRFLFRGIGSTFIHSFITVASFGLYSFITRKWNSNQIEQS